MGGYRQLNALGAFMQRFPQASAEQRESILTEMRQMAGLGIQVRGLQMETERLRQTELAGRRAEAMMPSQIGLAEAQTEQAQLGVERTRSELEDYQKTRQILEREFDMPFESIQRLAEAGQLRSQIQEQRLAQTMGLAPRRVTAEARQLEQQALGNQLQAAVDSAKLQSGYPKAVAAAEKAVADLTRRTQLSEIRRNLAQAKSLQARTAGEMQHEALLRESLGDEQYERLIVSSVLTELGARSDVTALVNQIRQAETSVANIRDNPQMADPMIQQAIQRNPAMAVFVRPTGNIQEAVKGLERYILVSKGLLKEWWGMDYDDYVQRGSAFRPPAALPGEGEAAAVERAGVLPGRQAPSPAPRPTPGGAAVAPTRPPAAEGAEPTGRVPGQPQALGPERPMGREQVMSQLADLSRQPGFGGVSAQNAEAIITFLSNLVQKRDSRYWVQIVQGSRSRLVDLWGEADYGSLLQVVTALAEPQAQP